MKFGAPEELLWLLFIPVLAFLMWNGNRLARERLHKLTISGSAGSAGRFSDKMAQTGSPAFSALGQHGLCPGLGSATMGSNSRDSLLPRTRHPHRHRYFPQHAGWGRLT